MFVPATPKTVYNSRIHNSRASANKPGMTTTTEGGGCLIELAALAALFIRSSHSNNVGSIGAAICCGGPAVKA